MVSVWYSVGQIGHIVADRIYYRYGTNASERDSVVQFGHVGYVGHIGRGGKKNQGGGVRGRPLCEIHMQNFFGSRPVFLYSATENLPIPTRKRTYERPSPIVPVIAAEFVPHCLCRSNHVYGLSFIFRVFRVIRYIGKLTVYACSPGGGARRSPTSPRSPCIIREA